MSPHSQKSVMLRSRVTVAVALWAT